MSAAAGAVNAIAGGGTLLTFPALIALGISPKVANATSTVALWPGALASLWGYRATLAGARSWAVRFAAPSLLGGLAGALLLLVTPPDQFSALAPWLVLTATVLFAVHGPVLRLARRHGAVTHIVDDRDGTPLAPPPVPFLAYQLLVSVYGGYFGAGVGILMLAALGFMGLTNIHRMNGLKNWGGMCMNIVAAATFIISGLVNWPIALVMAAGATLGGYSGSRLAQRVGQEKVRIAIAGVGVGAAVWLFLRG